MPGPEITAPGPGSMGNAPGLVVETGVLIRAWKTINRNKNAWETVYPGAGESPKIAEQWEKIFSDIADIRAKIERENLPLSAPEDIFTGEIQSAVTDFFTALDKSAGAPNTGACKRIVAETRQILVDGDSLNAPRVFGLYYMGGDLPGRMFAAGVIKAILARQSKIMEGGY